MTPDYFVCSQVNNIFCSTGVLRLSAHPSRRPGEGRRRPSSGEINVPRSCCPARSRDRSREGLCPAPRRLDRLSPPGAPWGGGGEGRCQLGVGPNAEGRLFLSGGAGLCETSQAGTGVNPSFAWLLYRARDRYREGFAASAHTWRATSDSPDTLGRTDESSRRCALRPTRASRRRRWRRSVRRRRRSWRSR